jgi:hypothetical protein
MNELSKTRHWKFETRIENRKNVSLSIFIRKCEPNQNETKQINGQTNITPPPNYSIKRSIKNS